MSPLSKIQPRVRQTRDRAATEARLVAAVGQVISDDGFEALGTRTVARRAGVDHMLINRYFGSLDGLFQAYADSSEFWPTVEELTDNGAIEHLPLSERCARILINLAVAIKARPMMTELMSAETRQSNELTRRMMERRQDSTAEIARLYFADLGQTRDGVDGQDLLLVLSAAIHYLAIRSRRPHMGFGGMGLESPEQVARLSAVINSVCGMLEPAPTDIAKAAAAVEPGQ
ncbi:hypothetical protein BZG35_16360 [Brevundimonas sp. LM2]|uniref:TetR/AcrR family transcriptional regulator n=1 Tax=Brevundimonas sp. LM2 TaxID=1938605 RepID=UPI00098391FF|nr:TetR/AcrR family transcriptional regulator [Brevundimonas sp. LM2]AQR63055.1 hypothetical protein BZG35_16360 [Brevundimonas sp. LM2]